MYQPQSLKPTKQTALISPLSCHTLAVLLSVIIIFFCLGIGFGSWSNPLQLDDVIWQIRYPRVLTSLLVGLALSVGGAALQALFENPLADASLIGTSGGAALGVVLSLSLSLGGFAVSMSAFIGSLLVCLLILVCHRWLKGGKIGLLILGFIISAFCGALVSLILFLSDDMVLRSATNWLAGSLAEAGFVPLRYAISCMLIGLLMLLGLGRKLDILMLGETTAISMGMTVVTTQMWVIIACALLTGAAVSLSGIIGFIGMIVPNLLVGALGGGRQKIMFYSGWLGAIFLLVVDSIARQIAYPVDVPVGIILALLGAPFFIWLFVQRRWA